MRDYDISKKKQAAEEVKIMIYVGNKKSREIRQGRLIVIVDTG